MATRQRPQESTYQTKMLPLFKEINSRGVFATNKDNNYINVFPNFIQNKTTQENFIDIIKRAGTSQVVAASGSGEVRGYFKWVEQSQYYQVVNRDIRIYNANTDALITTLTNVFAAGTTDVGFELFQYASGVLKVVATDGTTLVTIDATNTVASSTGYPVHEPCPVYLDGYIFVVKVGTGDIYNSDQDDPNTVTPGSFITAEILADQLYYLTRLNNYLIAMGGSSLEYFWDAGVATGSPLQRNDTPVKLCGYLGAIARIGNRVYFVGNQNNSAPDVFMLEEMKITPLSNETVREHLASLNLSASYATILRGHIVHMHGRDFYVLYTGTETWAMELETMLWHRWTYGSSTTNFPIQHSLSITTRLNTRNLFSLASDRAIYKFSDTVYQDNGVTFTCTIVTENESFGSRMEKVMSRLIPLCDRPAVDSTLNISWSDDDYQSFSTPRAININAKKPAITQLGAFNERAFKLTYTDNLPFRITGMEVNLNMGNS